MPPSVSECCVGMCVCIGGWMLGTEGTLRLFGQTLMKAWCACLPTAIYHHRCHLRKRLASLTAHQINNNNFHRFVTKIQAKFSVKTNLTGIIQHTIDYCLFFSFWDEIDTDICAHINMSIAHLPLPLSVWAIPHFNSNSIVTPTRAARSLWWVGDHTRDCDKI